MDGLRFLSISVYLQWKQVNVRDLNHLLAMDEVTVSQTDFISAVSMVYFYDTLKKRKKKGMVDESMFCCNGVVLVKESSLHGQDD